MTDEVLEQPQQTDEQAESDFAKGFSPAPEQSAPEQKTEQTSDAAGTETATETVAPKQEAKAAEPARIAGMTEEEWNAAVAKATGSQVEELRKEIRQNFGQIGNLTRTVNELKAARGNATAGRKITADLLKRVNEELPGLGQALAADLQEIMGGAEEAQANAEAKGQAFDPEKYFSEKVVPALQELEARNNEKAELRIVKSIHRDFDAVVKSEDFSGWLKTLPEDRQREVRESEDGFVAADAVTEFKTWRDRTKKDKTSKQTRLEAAVSPQGVPAGGGPQPTDEDAEFNAGFKRAAKTYAR